MAPPDDTTTAGSDFDSRSSVSEFATLAHPRELVVVPGEAEIVRRVWAELADHSLAEVAERLNRDGVGHRGPWTREAVKDIWRRGRFYLGFVVEKRGREEREGRHEAILDEAQYERTTAAIATRRRVGNKPKPFRAYLLRGLPWCICGTRLRGGGPRPTRNRAPLLPLPDPGLPGTALSGRGDRGRGPGADRDRHPAGIHRRRRAGGAPQAPPHSRRRGRRPPAGTADDQARADPEAERLGRPPRRRVPRRA
jgi:hypothetical protein